MAAATFLLFAGNECLLFLVVLLHALILFSATSAIAAALDNSTDLSSLLAFKAASTTTSGGDASDNIIAANWTTNALFCTWVGVAVAGVGRGSSPSTSAASPCKVLMLGNFLYTKIGLIGSAASKICWACRSSPCER